MGCHQQKVEGVEEVSAKKFVTEMRKNKRLFVTYITPVTSTMGLPDNTVLGAVTIDDI
jgi:hypothetical protein